MKNLYNLLYLFLGVVTQGFAQTEIPFSCVTEEQSAGATSLNALNVPEYSGSYDLEYLETFPPISFNIHFWTINMTGGSASAYVTPEDIQLSMDILNKMYKFMGICFVMHGLDTINDTYIYEDKSAETIMNYAAANGKLVPNCFNVYLPRTILGGGSGGTFFGNDKLVVGKAVIMGIFGVPRGYTLAHELAHTFNLRHPWGDANNVATTLEHVTRDPNDPNYNALTVADHIHDTAAMVSFSKEAQDDGVPIEDIIDPVNCEYLGDLTDNLGVPFSLTSADVGNPMAYGAGNCVTGFTVGQGIRIREYINGSPSSASVQLMTNDICINCSESLVISEPIVASEILKAVNTITATSALNDYIQVIYSGEQIILNPGFETGTETAFLAKVDPCSLNSPRQSSTTKRLMSDYENKIILNDLFNMSPNPANGTITINATQEIKSIIITSPDGKIVYQNNPPGKNTSINVVLEGYAQSIYNITIITSNGEKQTRKMVKN